MKIKSLHLKNLILVAIFALMSGSAWAQGVSSFGVQYGTGSDTYWIYYSIIQDPNYTNAVEVYNGGNYNNYSGAIEVPETVTHSDVTYTVCGVADEAFYDTRTDAAVTSVSLPTTVRYIGNRAFYQCKNMTTVNIPSAVTSIGDWAFFDCRKLMVSDGVLTIPNAVTIIGKYAFQACHALKNVTIGTGITSIGEGAFMGCTGLETIYYNAANCTSYGSYVWSGCTHTPCTLNIGNTVQSLPNSAFSGYSALTTLNFVATSQLTTISQYAFSGCTSIGAINIPNSVTSIEQSAFRNCEAATSLSLGSGVVTIGKAAFAYCYGLTSLDIPANVKTLERNDGSATGVFAYTGLTSLVIPNTLESLGREAFANCPDLETVTIGTGVTYIDHLLFAGCPKLSVVNYNVTEIPYVADMYGDQVLIWNGCTSDCTVNIGDNVKGLPHDIFRGFTHLKTINFGSHENFSIGFRAFASCSGLTTLDIPDNVTTLDDYAFNGCTGLTTVNIGSGVTTIGSSAFSYCSELTSLDLSSVETIGSNAFSHCIALRLLTIPASVSEIQESGGANGAFSFCSNLEEIWFMGATQPTIASHTFDNVPNTALCYVPKGYENIAPFTNVPYLRFVGGTNNNNWNNASNWVGATDYAVQAAPAVNEAVVIDGANDPILPEGTVAQPSLIKLNEGRRIIINDGAQLIYNAPIRATVQKEITAASYWTTQSNGWYFIASPVEADPEEIEGMLSDPSSPEFEYDLYYYDESSYTWRNYKADPFELHPCEGYLYAGNNDVCLEFTGTMPAANAEMTQLLGCTASYLKGFNLVGNPFTHNLNAGDITLGGTPVTTYYMVENGAEIVPAQLSTEPIQPGRGFMVQATEVGQQLVFNPTTSKGNTSKVGYVSISAGNDAFTDKAFIQMGGGNTLRKMTLADNTPKVYVQQGDYNYAVANVTALENMIPVAFEAVENGTYTIAVDVKGIETNYLHLIDNLTGADIDLLATPSYSFEANTSDYASRFRLVFNADGSSTGSEAEVFAFYDGREWVIANTDEATLQVVDMTGRVLSTETISGNATININQPAGVYVMRLMNGEHVKVQKVVVR